MRQREGGWSSLYIAGDLIRGHTETIILARLMQRDSYGYAEDAMKRILQRVDKNCVLLIDRRENLQTY